jgi:hypothetical protein
VHAAYEYDRHRPAVGAAAECQVGGECRGESGVGTLVQPSDRGFRLPCCCCLVGRSVAHVLAGPSSQIGQRASVYCKQRRTGRASFFPVSTRVAEAVHIHKQSRHPCCCLLQCYTAAISSPRRNAARCWACYPVLLLCLSAAVESSASVHAWPTFGGLIADRHSTFNA